jgi:hypothetical protein
MPISAAENRFVMDQLTQRSRDDIRALWDAAVRLPDVDFFTYVSDAFPDIVIPYHQLAAEFAASAFEEDFPALAVTAVVADPPPVEALRKSAQWALGADGIKAIDRMAATTQRHIYDGNRDTTATNAEASGLRWVRIARPNACAFCRLLASRAAVDSGFASQQSASRVVGRRGGARGSRKLGEKYHDDCQCTVKAVPAGRNTLDYLYQEEPEAAFTAEQYLNEYNKARDEADSGDTKAILSQWRQLSADIT